MPRPPRPFLTGRPLAFAHRGGSALWPENTLEAFRGALDLGLRLLETDLHATRDGVLVCHHDERVDRTTNGTGFIRDLSLAELRKLDAGYAFSPDGVSFPWRGKGLTVPTLSEVVMLHPEARLNVEIKQREPDLCRPLWEFIAERDLTHRFLVAAEKDALVRRFRKVSAGRVATSAGHDEATAFWIASRLRATRLLPLPYDALQVPEHSGPLHVVDERFIRAAHRRGVVVHVWTVDREHDIRRLLALGVDGIMTDRPDVLARVLLEARA